MCSWRRQRWRCQRRRLLSRSQLQRWHVAACGAASCSSACGRPGRRGREQVGSQVVNHRSTVSDRSSLTLWKGQICRQGWTHCIAESEAPSEGEKPKYDSIGELVTLPSGSPEVSDLPNISLRTSSASRGTELSGIQCACAVQAYSIARWRLVQVVRCGLLSTRRLAYCSTATRPVAGGYITTANVLSWGRRQQSVHFVRYRTPYSGSPLAPTSRTHLAVSSLRLPYLTDTFVRGKCS